jgi:hypothetical protein
VAVTAAATALLTATPADAATTGVPIPPADPSALPRGAQAQAGKKAISADLPGTAVIVRDGITLLHLRTTVNSRPAKGAGPTRSDFDGDGRDDIAAFSTAGVVVTYSSAPVRDRLITEIPGGSGCVCYGTEMVTGNFNGDKYDDLAIGDPDEVDLKSSMGYHAGAVWIFSGGPSGLRVGEVKHINQSTIGIPGTSAQGDWFADALAAGDITGDGRDELLVGVPHKTISGKREAGVVVVLKGGSAGVAASGATWIHQNTTGVPGGVEAGDHFGSGIAIGKINKDRYLDVVVGAPQEDDGKSFGGSGAVTQFWGSSAGPSLKKVTAVYGASTFAVAEKKDAVLWYIGGQLAIGDTTGDGYGEVIIGDAAAQANWNINGGVVISLPGRSTGLSTKGMILLSQRDNDIAGASENDDYFGDSIAVGDMTGDGRADVLVGVPGEDIGKAVDAGTVVLLRGSAKGLTGAKSQSLTQSSAGVPDSTERGDTFGAAVSVLNLNGNKWLDAAVGSPGELVAGDPAGYSSGAVSRLYGGNNGLGSGTAVNGRALGVETSGYGYLAHQ